MKTSNRANNGTDDKAQDTPVSEATAPIQNTNEDNSDLLERFEEMKEEVAPTIECFENSLSKVKNPKDLKLIGGLFIGTLLPSYDKWEEICDSYPDELDEREAEVVRKNMILGERKLAALLPDIEDDWRDICEYCECNAYVRQQIAKIIEEAA